MSEETKIESTPGQSRRAFVKTAAQVAVTAPAAAMLLNATTAQARIGDDFGYVSQNDPGNPNGEDDKIPAPGTGDDGFIGIISS